METPRVPTMALVAVVLIPGPQAPASGVTTKSVLVLSLQSAGGTPHCSNATLRAEVFTAANSVRAFFVENSYGLASISGQVSGPYPIAVGQTCDLVGWADQADAAAAAAGMRVSDYDSTIYVLPPESNALGCIPGSARRALRPGDRYGQRITIREDTCDSKFNFAHELGHAFGVEHASIAESYVPRPAPDARQTIARQLFYGDLSSVMGGILDGLVDVATERALFNETPHFNAPQKISVGWLPAGRVQAVTRDGTYQVALLETAVNDVQALTVTAGDSTYYISYRRAVGFDASLPSQYVDKTSIHTSGTQPGVASILHATLGDGQSYSNRRFTITQARHDATRAYVRISFR